MRVISSLSSPEIDCRTCARVSQPRENYPGTVATHTLSWPVEGQVADSIRFPFRFDQETRYLAAYQIDALFWLHTSSGPLAASVPQLSLQSQGRTELLRH